MVVRELGLNWLRGASGIWADLLRRSDANPVFMSWEWISSWMETLVDAADGRILGAYAGDRLLAVTPLVAKASYATLWGGHVSLAGVEQTGADYSDIVCVRGHEDEVAQAVAAWLVARNDWVQCEFRDVLPTAIVRHMAALMAGGNVMEDGIGNPCPRTSLGNGWLGMLRDRFESKRRYNIQRQLRLAEEREGLRLVLHDTPEAVLRAFPTIVKLHNERKAAQGIKSAFSEPERLNFHLRAAIKLAETSRGAFVATLESPRQALSAAYCLRSNRSLYYFQTGVSSTGSARGAGSTLLYMLLRWAANEGYDWFDFLKGDEDYKRAWATHHVEQRAIRVTRPSLRGRSMLGLNAIHRALAFAYQSTIGGKERT